MKNSILKIVISCGIVTVLTALPFLFYADGHDDYNIDEVLNDLKSHTDISQAEKRFNQYVSVLERVPIHDNSVYHQRAVDLRYQAGQNMIGRNDKNSVEAALRQFQMINQKDPSYNHGWLQFYRGEIFQKLQKWDEALKAFAAVSLYNHSRLELRARFLKAVLLKAQDMPVSSFDAYLYLRFASAFPFSDAALVNAEQWSDTEYVPYIQALAQYDANNKTQAAGLMNSYLQSHQNDLSAHYFLNAVQDQQEKKYRSISPRNVYSNGTLANNGFALSNGHSILADFYADPNSMIQTSVIITFENPLNTEIEMEFILNQQQPIVRTGRKSGKSMEAVLHTQEERNLLEIRWFANVPAESAAIQNTAIQIQDISISTNPSEPQL